MLTKRWYIKSKVITDSLYKATPGGYVLIVWALFFLSSLFPVEARAKNLTKESQHASLNTCFPEDTDNVFHPLYSPKEPNPVPENSDKSGNNEKANGFDDNGSKAFCFISASCYFLLDQILSALPGQDSLRNRATVSLVILYQSWKICFDFIS